jgi:hypothetical protein
MVRVIIALVAAYSRCQFIQSDIVSTYLNVLLKAHEPSILLRSPQGMDGVPDGHVLQLNINLYGLCQSTCRWYCDLSSTLTQHGWRKHKHPTETCLWLCQDDPATPANR